MRPAFRNTLRASAIPPKATPRSYIAPPKLRRSVSTLSHPYRFHTGASWAGKPIDSQHKRLKVTPWPKDSPVGRWRDHVLSRSDGKHIGEDFFYIQEVRDSFA